MRAFINAVRQKNITGVFRWHLLLIPLFVLSEMFAQSMASAKFAIIGDYGSEGQPLQDVSTLVASWNPDFIITTGDNNYPDGEAATIDANVGQYFHDFIFPYPGGYGNGADSNRFFPCLGNHDWDTPGAAPYLDYFSLPGNERYYRFSRGPVEFFVLDSDAEEPDGNSPNSIQGNWLQNALQASRAIWKIVYMHHPPYSSGKHGSTPEMQWPFKAWGATVVISGHDHTYERIVRDGLTYIVNGLGGRSLYNFQNMVSGSQVRYNEDYGAMLAEASPESLSFQFINRGGQTIDAFTIDTSPLGVTPGEPEAGQLHFDLSQNYPNPFNGLTVIQFTLNSPATARLTVFSVAGTFVRQLMKGSLSEGTYRVEWDGMDGQGRRVASGYYFYRLYVDERFETRKMLLLK